MTVVASRVETDGCPAAIERLKVFEDDAPSESVTVISISAAENIAVGVPLSKPELLSDNPEGKLPDVNCQSL